MGRKDKRYSKDLHQQAHERLTSMLAFGESRREGKKREEDFDKIYSKNTYDTYKKHVNLYIRWVKEKYPECTTLKAARKHVNEWLQEQVDKPGASASTVHTKAKALGKLYNIRSDDPNYFTPPQRKREDIKRSRVDAVRDRHFSVTNNDEFIKFCRGVGGRRSAIGRLKADDLWSRDDMIAELKIALSGVGISSSDGDKNIIANIKEALETFPDQDYFVHYVKDKGGRSRFAPIIGKNKQQIIERMTNTLPGKKVWEHVPTNADIHSFRADYATLLYKMCARNIEDIPRNEKIRVGNKWKSAIYICRKDEAKKKLDRAAMLKCSKALGHNRESVVADHYLRAL